MDARNQLVHMLAVSLAAAAVLTSCQCEMIFHDGRCAAPRSGTDPVTGQSYPDRPGTLDDEKKWLRSWTSESYLWYREVPDADPGAYATPIEYFEVLKTPALTASGKPKDRFHFTYPTAAWEALALSGTQPGYGIEWVITSYSPPRGAVAAYAEPGSPAAAANVQRGARVLTVDGVDLAHGTDLDTLNAGMFPTAAGETHTLTVLDSAAAAPREVTMTSADVRLSSVPLAGAVAGHPAVGYLLFNDHFASAERGLFDAITQLKAMEVAELVVDMRYNGGGYLDIASQLAFMVAGPTPTAGKVFEREIFNDHGFGMDPVPFRSETLGLSLPARRALPSLALSRLVVLTGPGTCSASEALINGLRGVDLEVILIGATTCGKPYGFVPRDNCGTTYFSIEMQGVNAKGFGDYADGFVPGARGDAGAPGCQVADDFDHQLGDPSEARLAAALQYLSDQTCPPATPNVLENEPLSSSPTAGAIGPRPWWRQNRLFWH